MSDDVTEKRVRRGAQQRREAWRRWTRVGTWGWGDPRARPHATAPPRSAADRESPPGLEGYPDDAHAQALDPSRDRPCPGGLLRRFPRAVVLCRPLPGPFRIHGADRAGRRPDL